MGDDTYFTSLIQYIHANPVTANLCTDYKDWEFSSYNSIIKNAPTQIKREEIIDWFGNIELFIKIHRDRKLEMDQFKDFLFD